MLSRASAFLFRSTSAFVVCVSAMPAMAGPDWVEGGDAGSFFLTAQAPRRPDGAEQLRTISGSLASGVLGDDFEDLYFIRIINPAAFTASVEFSEFNAKLFLFDITVNDELFGRLANDDGGEDSTLPFLSPASTDGTSVIITRPGDYILGISGATRNAFSRSGPIFSLASPTEISGPDGTGGINPLDHWEGGGAQGQYRIVFTETDFPATPAPGFAVLGVAGGVLAMRRRRAQ
jgi:hypothetical protein